MTPPNPSIKKIFEENGLTAAEVGGMAPAHKMANLWKQLWSDAEKEIEQLEADTIERCAQAEKAINGEIEGHIALCSMRPSPLSSEGKAWESGARQGWSWAIDNFAAAIRALKP